MKLEFRNNHSEMPATELHTCNITITGAPLPGGLYIFLKLLFLWNTFFMTFKWRPGVKGFKADLTNVKALRFIHNLTFILITAPFGCF